MVDRCRELVFIRTENFYITLKRFGYNCSTDMIEFNPVKIAVTSSKLTPEYIWDKERR